MRKLAWRLALAAALACLQPTPLQATSPNPPSASDDSGAESVTVPATTSAPTLSVPKVLSGRSPAVPPTPKLDDLGRLLGFVTLFAALVGGAIYLIKFGLPLHRNRAKEERKLQVLEMRPLGNRQFLLVVGYEETRMLLGVTPGKIDYLCPLDGSPGTSDFSSLLNELPQKESHA
jgi:flagellar biogenesis protein FliO